MCLKVIILSYLKSRLRFSVNSQRIWITLCCTFKKKLKLKYAKSYAKILREPPFVSFCDKKYIQGMVDQNKKLCCYLGLSELCRKFIKYFLVYKIMYTIRKHKIIMLKL